MCDPRPLSSLRTVIAVAERMPDLGRKIYETGPAFGIAKLTAYLRAQVDAGVLAIDDCEVAAAQFIETCHATMFKPMLFNFAPPPTPERITPRCRYRGPHISCRLPGALNADQNFDDCASGVWRRRRLGR